ncbi:putative hydroxylacyl-CoA dehydrogenase [Actinacidiphila reveromycinica]|uniref:Putative hydroxylacyl-CoA dehydrogenase n=1 Tax=Actinacidiphila reveromycinica TaxID=659352 RepID=A0A7U3UY30_9ACTN|nr:M14 family zinc carboxypeptidase [Streptomyces sp. SN-593]BBB00998.1 putative hydroxylacyl-CoA dehydrogenase [Streptomyces sp. SN-593]
MTEECYPTTADITQGARRLTLRYHGLCRLAEVGRSRAGRPLLLLTVGQGPRNVLVVAGPHANEAAVGGATVLRLAERIAETCQAGDGDGSTWHFLLCIDPDGAALNEPWLAGPYTLRRHYEHFFRPCAAEQPEWLPPDGAVRAATLPETRTLVELLDRLRPVLQCSLHGIDVGGSFVQLTRDVPGVAERIGKSAAELDIPLESGSSDAFQWPSPGAGVYVMPPASDPAAGDGAHSTWAHAERYDGVTAIVEVPMWACDRAADTTPHPDADRALRVAGAALRRDLPTVAGLLDRIDPRLIGADSPMLRTVRELVGIGPQLSAEWDPAVRPAGAGGLPEMTTARVTSIEVYAQRIPLRAAAMLRRIAALPAVTRLVDSWCDAYEAAYHPRWVPVADQVEQQARSVMAVYQELVS